MMGRHLLGGSQPLGLHAVALHPALPLTLAEALLLHLSGSCLFLSSLAFAPRKFQLKSRVLEKFHPLFLPASVLVSEARGAELGRAQVPPSEVIIYLA